MRSSCSKLTASFINVSLKFPTLISQIRDYFLLKKCEELLHCNAKAPYIFFTKNIGVFGSCCQAPKELIP